MSILNKLARRFDAASRARGAQYLAQDRVRIESDSPTSLSAVVRGSEPYQVDLHLIETGLGVSCTCPRFEDSLCKHIWAVMNTAKAVQLLRRLEPDSGLVAIRHDFDTDVYNGEDAEEAVPVERSAPKRAAQLTGGLQSKQPLRVPGWRERLDRIASAKNLATRMAPPTRRELLYVIDMSKRTGGSAHLEIWHREPKRDGTWSKPRGRYLERAWLEQHADPSDRLILSHLEGAKQSSFEYSFQATGWYGDAPFSYALRGPQAEVLLPMMCATNRCYARLTPQDDMERWLPITWDAGDPWAFRVEMQLSPQTSHYQVTGTFRRDGECMALSDALMIMDAGVLFTRCSASRYDPQGAIDWLTTLAQEGSFKIPTRDAQQFVAELWRMPEVPPLEVPTELRYEQVRIAPRPELIIKAEHARYQPDLLQGELRFHYEGSVISASERRAAMVQEEQRRVVLRDEAAEAAATERLLALGWRRPKWAYVDAAPFNLNAKRLPQVLRHLLAEGWQVEAQGTLYRSPGRFKLEVHSGIDWFELHGEIEFGDTRARLPELLAAIRRGQHTVRLDDGTLGLLPEEWMQRYGLFAGVGTAHEDHLRFKRSQAGLLDALLAEQPDTSSDATFAQLRSQLQDFSGVQSLAPPHGFIGELRPYQQEGLGWLHFLQRFGFGGCLADDMGLGKTVQVLALLESRRQLREHAQRSERPPPSLVVMPKSLIFNWKQEAARFTPRLRILDHTGVTRKKGVEHFEEWDVIFTTYGTLRRDAVEFKDTRFDYLILDEAQAIKNAASESAKATRLLQGNHRLALSGTPVENHLGELWSLFEFLNPGMLGTTAVFKLMQSQARSPDADTRQLLAQALRPFLLRRTKEQVARDLPAKLEQTLYCELDSKQRKLYDELREHYRTSLLQRVESHGIQRAKMQILEALLRLRQAAIHPGLLDKERTNEPSAKLDMLLPRLDEVLDEGHKALVFSQFTGMLTILRHELDRKHIEYEYLDGKTRDRQARVERFQSDPDCKLFLISLKAGGVGLNLTAAQYVFLLDPWWNPAVEAQAIDRAHRIGQSRHVFAYRLIARGTVEEKVLELQNTKRDLADAILNADNALIRNLGKEDLELLLS